MDGRELGAIFAGGAAGRPAAGLAGDDLHHRGASGWPWTIFAINITGSVALAYFATRLQERLPLSTYRRPLLGTGFCGAYTTFSTMQVEILTMLDHHRDGLAIGYAAASLAAGYLAIWLTTGAVRRARLIA